MLSVQLTGVPRYKVFNLNPLACTIGATILAFLLLYFIYLSATVNCS